jgi:hypothetical protein
VAIRYTTVGYTTAAVAFSTLICMIEYYRSNQLGEEGLGGGGGFVGKMRWEGEGKGVEAEASLIYCRHSTLYNEFTCT